MPGIMPIPFLLSNKATVDPIIYDGLTFWSKADPTLIEEVSGLVYKIYDIRDGYGGSRFMVQNTSTLRPVYTSNRLYFDQANKCLTRYDSGNIKTMFVVLNNITASPGGIGIVNAGSSPQPDALQKYSLYSRYYRNSVDKNYFCNNSKKSTLFSLGTGYKILHTADDFNYSAKTITVGYIFGFAGANQMYIKEWGWYNRVLTDDECLYNIGKLNERYSIY